MEPITLRADGAGLTLAPSIGGAVTRYWLERDGATWEWLRPAPVMAAFPLVPYSNRIREGRFAFRGRTVALPLNRPPERHAIHGHGWQARWQVIEAGPSEPGSSIGTRPTTGRGPIAPPSTSRSGPRASRW